MSSKPIIELTNIWKKYKIKRKSSNTLREDIEKIFSTYQKEILAANEFWALNDINISIKKGESIGLYGPNGSGKTTIIRIISRVTYPTKGEMLLRGSIAPLISVGAGFHPELTGKENIYTNGTILGMSIKELKKKEMQIIKFSGLEPKFMDMPVKNYSSGMIARLGFSVAVHSDADIFLLDEVLAVGDSAFKDKCSDKIDSLMKKNKTFIIVTHNLENMKKVTNRIIYMEKGKIINETN